MDYYVKLKNLTTEQLTPDEFDHKDHVGVAYEALRRHDFFHAVAEVATGIQRLTEKAGAPEKFNATITSAFMSLIAERMETGDYKDAQDFIDHNPDLMRGSAIAHWYSKARLHSPLARTIVLLPDQAAAI